MKKFNYFPVEKYEVVNKQKCYKSVMGYDDDDFIMAYGVKTGETFEDDQYFGDIIKWMTENELKAIGVNV